MAGRGRKTAGGKMGQCSLSLRWHPLVCAPEEFVKESVQNQTGKHAGGKRSIWFNGKKKAPFTAKSVEYCK